jgi:uncharacterized protein involved in exopolysaccharide biosynthesis
MNARELVIYWRIIKKRFWLIFLLVAVTIGVMVGLSYMSEPLYQTSASFQVTTPPPADVAIFSEFRTATSRDELEFTKNNFIQVLVSDYVVGQVIESLGLAVEPRDLIEKQVIIEPVEGSDLVKLTVTAARPDTAALIANKMVEFASQRFAELSAGSLTANREFIQQQIVEVKDDLDQSKAELVQFQIENKVGDLTSLLDRQQSLISNLKLHRDESLAASNQLAVASFDDSIALRERELQDLISLSVDYEELQERVTGVERTYRGLLDKQIEAELKENEVLSAKFIRIVPAREPKRPLPLLNPILLTVGAAVSLVAGIMLAFLLQALSDLSAVEEENLVQSKRVISAPGK